MEKDKIINYDFTSLYPNIIKVYDDKTLYRAAKIKKILKRLNSTNQFL